MQRKLNIAVLSIILLIALQTVSYSQVIGKIFTKEEANTQFGSVASSVHIDAPTLKKILAKTNKYVMFRVVNGEVTILGDGRKAIYPNTEAVVGKEDVYHLFSVSIVAELLNKGSDVQIYIENRKETLTITYGSSTLELSILCPPFCPEN